MALAERAELIARLSLKDEFTRPLQGVQGKLSRFGSAAGPAGKAIGVGVGAGLAVGTVAISRAVSAGLQSLADLESATTSVDAAIKQMGLTGQVTGQQVATWANEIETSIHGAFDDTDITKAATTLLRFGKVTSTNLRPALAIVADLATKTGDVGSASSLLAKALAAPEKAAGRLSRAGVILTKTQQDQITALVKAGKVGQAQALILDAVAKATKGAADASQGPYQKSLTTLHDTVRDAERALAEGFLPVIEKVRSLLSEELAKPQTLQNIRDFGKGLAGGLDQLVEVARKVPWGSIGDALKIGGAGAKIILDAFASMPPWVQTAIATGWGLNKLTGGAVSGLIGSLASGLIKGVLGMNAGVVNINAAVVNGAGGGAGLPSAAGGAAGVAKTGISTLGKVFLVGEAIGLVAAVNEVRDNIAGQLTQQATDIHGAVTNQINDQKTTQAQLVQSLAGVNQGIEALSHDPIGNLLLGDQLGELKKMRAELETALTKTQGDQENASHARNAAHEASVGTAKTHAHLQKVQTALEDQRHQMLAKFQSGINTTDARTKGAVSSGSGAIVSAIRANRPVISVSVRVSTTSVHVTKNYRSGSTVGSGIGGGRDLNT